MTAFITGATGTIGKRLIKELGGDVVITSRKPERAREGLDAGAKVIGWDGESPLPDDALDGIDVIFHLTGEPVAEGRWTDEKKRRITRSRIESTKRLVDAIGKAKTKPRVLVSGSAVGWYGDRGDEVLTEESAPGTGFLAEVCRDWEIQALRAEEHGVRVVCLRTGVVLAREGGAFAEMLPLFKTGLAGKLGDGKQWMPWIHLDDIVGLFRFAASDERVKGALNGASAVPVTNATFTKAMGRAIHRPTLFTAPAFAMKLALGEKAAIILASQRVIPKKASDLGYAFLFSSLDDALADLCK